MNKLKDIFSKIKVKRLTIASDFLVMVSFFIVFFTTYMLVWWLGMYVLAIELFIISYLIARKGV